MFSPSPYPSSQLVSIVVPASSFFDGLNRQHSCISIRVFDRLLIAFHVEVFVKQRDAEAFSLPMLLQNFADFSEAIVIHRIQRLDIFHLFIPPPL